MSVAIEPGQAAQVDKSKQVPAQKAPSAPPPPPFWIELKTPAEMSSLTSGWEDLAKAAIEPNPFYEPWMLQEALETFGTNRDLVFVVVYRRLQSPKAPPQLVGLFPFERCRRYKFVPIRVWKLWKHLYCFSCVPLVHAQYVQEVLAILFDWAGHDRQSPSVMEWPSFTAEGPLHQALLDAVRQRGNTIYSMDTYNRALLKPAADAEAYCASGMTCHNRQEQRRQRRRLEEMGKLEFRTLSKKDEVDQWVDIFLQMESCGWKGQEHTAMAATARDAEYFRRISHAAFKRGELMMLGLFLDDRPIAAKCNFKSNHGSFAFKIGFDESLSKFSPGVQLELENIRAVHEMPQLQWMDSCAAPNHFMINRLWKDRRTVKQLMISTGRRSGELLLALIPFWRGIKKFIRGRLPSATKIANKAAAKT